MNNVRHFSLCLKSFLVFSNIYRATENHSEFFCECIFQNKAQQKKTTKQIRWWRDSQNSQSNISSDIKICNTNQPKTRKTKRNIWYPAPEICNSVTQHVAVMDLGHDIHRFIPILKPFSVLDTSQSNVSSIEPSYVSCSSSIIVSSSLLKERSVLPALMSSTCKLDRCAKELSSTESTESRLKLKKIKERPVCDDSGVGGRRD